jgi:hypothetical protein
MIVGLMRHSKAKKGVKGPNAKHQLPGLHPPAVHLLAKKKCNIGPASGTQKSVLAAAPPPHIAERLSLSEGASLISFSEAEPQERKRG